MLTLIVSVVVFSIITINLMVGFQERKMTKHYGSLYTAEHTKSFFAKARNEMMLLVSENKVDSKTDFFKGIYSLHTFIMRNPDSYSDFSMAFTKALLNIQKKKPAQLTESEKRISYLTADALGHIVINYSSFMRFYFRFVKGVTKNKINNHAAFIGHLAYLGNVGNKIQAEKEIKKAQEELYKLSRHSGISPC